MDVSFSVARAAGLNDMLFCRMPRSLIGGSKRKRANLFKALLMSDKGKAPAPMRLKPLEASDLEPELVALCRRMGGTGWEGILKAIHDWLKDAKGLERSMGLEALRLVIEEIKDLVSQIEAWKRELTQQNQSGTELARQLEERIAESTEKVRHLLQGFLGALPGWFDEW
jgi:hypothetical protein